MTHISEIIENILVEWAYRVHDGMPNPKNAQHIHELRESMEELNLPNKVIYEVINNLINEEEEKLTVHKGQNPTTFYHEVLTALAVAGVNMSQVNNGVDMKKHMGNEVKAGVPGKEFKKGEWEKYMDNSTHAKFDTLKKDAMGLAKKLKSELGNVKGPVWWAGPTNDSSDYGAADIVANFAKYDDVGVSLKYDKGQLKNLTVTTLGKALNLKNFDLDYIRKKYKSEFDGMTSDWNTLILKEFIKHTKSNKNLDTKQRKQAIDLFTKIQKKAGNWDNYQKLKFVKKDAEVIYEAVDMGKVKDLKFRYFCRKFQETKIAKVWAEWGKKRNKRWDNIFGAAFKENEDDIEAGLLSLFQRQLSIGKKDMFYAASGGQTFWFIPSEDRFADLIKDIHLEYDLENKGSGYIFNLYVHSSVTGQKIAVINVTTRYTQGQMDGIGSKSNYKLYAKDWSDIFGDWK